MKKKTGSRKLLLQKKVIGSLTTTTSSKILGGASAQCPFETAGSGCPPTLVGHTCVSCSNC